MKRAGELNGDVRYSYHLNDPNADVYAKNLQIDHGGYRYDVVIKKEKEVHVIADLSLRIGGLHNVENSLPAIVLSHLQGLSNEQIRTALQSFSGVKRRFEYWIAPGEGNVVMIDDYAHHPEELRALITGARSLFSDYGLLLIFQPHLYSRTRDQVMGFGDSLDLADSVILLPIYPARELPIEGVSSTMILERMKIKEKRLMEKTALLERLKDYIEEQKRETKKDKWVVITAGAGDIDAMLPQLKEKLLHG